MNATSNFARQVNEPSTIPPPPGYGAAGNHPASAGLRRGRQPSTIPQFVWRIVEFIIGGVFIYAGVMKVSAPVDFANDIENFKILPWFISVRLAFYLPWLEILCGLALIARRFYSGALVILSSLMLVFIGATVAAKARGLDITCGCFGKASQNWSFTSHMAVDLALLATLGILWFTQRRGKL